MLNRINKIKGSQIVRRWAQFLFLAIVFFIGVRFAQFAGVLEQGSLPLVDRPAGVEVFLPISALVSLKYFALTGIINEVHPSGLVFFLIVCSSALIVRKGFCSWVCPFGLLSEYLSKIHYMIFKNGFTLPLFADRILRAVKYLLAGFFIWSIFFKMPLEAIEGFIKSPYNILADIKMMQFFTRISMTSLIVIIGLIVLSILIRNFWCRYLCPYGALVGILSFVSPGKINFNQYHCTDCKQCEKVCPGAIKIRKKQNVFSLECSACLQCINICPEKNALKYSFFNSRYSLGSKGIAMIFVILFMGGIGAAKMTGHWENQISKKQYLFYMMTQGMMNKVEPGNLQTPNQKLMRMQKMMEIMANQNDDPETDKKN